MQVVVQRAKTGSKSRGSLGSTGTSVHNRAAKRVPLRICASALDDSR